MAATSSGSRLLVGLLNLLTLVFLDRGVVSFDFAISLAVLFTLYGERTIRVAFSFIHGFGVAVYCEVFNFSFTSLPLLLISLLYVSK